MPAPFCRGQESGQTSVEFQNRGGVSVLPNEIPERESVIRVDGYNQMLVARGFRNQSCASGEAISGSADKLDRIEVAIGAMRVRDPFINGSMEGGRAVKIEEVVANLHSQYRPVENEHRTCQPN